MESLPGGPEWNSLEIVVEGGETVRGKEPILIWKDGLEVFQHAFADPRLRGKIDFAPLKILEIDENGKKTGDRIYTEMMTADKAHRTQVSAFHTSQCRLICL